jgi:hypothetical protein
MLLKSGVGLCVPRIGGGALIPDHWEKMKAQQVEKQ